MNEYDEGMYKELHERVVAVKHCQHFLKLAIEKLEIQVSRIVDKEKGNK